MGKINEKPLDNDITGEERILGSDEQGRTRQYPIAAIGEFLGSGQTGAEIKALYEAQADTNAFTDAEQSKLAGVESGATGDQTGDEITDLLGTRLLLPFNDPKILIGNLVYGEHPSINGGAFCFGYALVNGIIDAPEKINIKIG